MSSLPTIIYKKHHFSFFVVLTSYTNCSNCSWFIVLLKTLNRSYAEIRYTSKCTLFSMLKYIKTTIMLAKCLNVSIQNSCFSVTSYHSWVEGKWNNLQVYLPKITKRWQHSIQPKIDLSYNLYNYSTAVSTSRKCKWNRAISCRVSQGMHNFISYSLCLLRGGAEKHSSDGKFLIKWGEQGGLWQLPFFLLHCLSVSVTFTELLTLFLCIWNH